ncbi:MAG: HAMP domain-containing sensor histidine kinase [Actinomycetota bacterium]|nr:HAMP domain-containing sensor histidine kinase [Actinomycetota bacterium]
MRVWRSLRFRLFASYLLVIGISAGTLFLVSGIFAPVFFHDRLMGMDHGMGAAVEEALDSSLRRALVIAVAVGSTVALGVAAFVGGRILRPVERIRRASHRLAGGDYAEPVPLPAETELAALAADINTLAASLEATERRRQELLADLSHELRTPLTAIEGYMEGLIDGVIPAEPETFASVADEAARLKRLAADLLVLSRIDESTGNPVAEVDLGAIARGVTDRLRPQFEDQGVAVTVDCPKLTVRGDPDRLTQVVLNLLGNALAHTRAGGRVDVRGHRTNGSVELEVADDGVGIDPAVLEHVFDRFYRADPSRPGGTGIGLTIARRIARTHGGDLWARSSGLGNGATFTLIIPVG